jgi:hypothetical protein
MRVVLLCTCLTLIACSSAPGSQGGSPFGFGPDLGCSGKCPCTSDVGCGGATPRCDLNSGKCVPCLPVKDNCPLGMRCIPQNGNYLCTSSCVTDKDCPRTDGGAPASCCNGACVDSSSDIANCGRCGMSCPLVAHGQPGCAAGMCGLASCNQGFADCNGTAADGCEVDTTTDAKNCGGCGKPCAAGPNASAACMAGSCTITCAKGFADCDKNPANGCEVYTDTDLNNCGACGSLCGNLPNAVPLCLAGVCSIASCKMGFSDCNMKTQDGCEANTQTDILNCGQCAAKCNLPNATPMCNGGSCAIASCNIGFSDCDGVAANGCESATMSDANNCGACGRVCSGPNSVQGCVMGGCVIMSCSPGFSDCDMNPKTGCEVNVAMDPNNCGGCGMNCPVPANATASCTNATCGIGMCKPGFADCNMNAMDGCETNVMTVQNCGKCNNVCMAPANATAGCNNGICGIGMCNNLFGDCDMNPFNGCEKDLSADVNNCGKCGGLCSVANGAPGCLNGVCRVASCNQGFADCDLSYANGCEVNTNTDAKNCGKCGNPCPVNAPTCANGVCTGVAQCMRIGWKSGNANWACPVNYRMPTVNEWNAVAPCVTPQDNAMFSYYYDVAVSVGGCNCKWNANWCGQPSIVTIRQGTCCGDYTQLQICLTP